MAEQIPTKKEIDLHTPIFDVLIERYKKSGLEISAVYGQYWRWCNWSGDVCIQSYEEIGHAIGLSGRTVKRCFDVLVADGYLLDLTPNKRNDPHQVRITPKMSTEARENGHTSFTKKGARKRTSSIGMTESHTNNGIQDAGMTESPIGMTASPTGMTESQSGYDRESVEDTIEDFQEIKKEEEEKTAPSSSFDKKEQSSVDLWMTVVNPDRISEINKQKIIAALGDHPDQSALEEASRDWQKYAQGKANSQGKPYSADYPPGIIERYKVILKKKPLTYKVDPKRVVVIWSDGVEVEIDKHGNVEDRMYGQLYGVSRELDVCPSIGETEYRKNSLGEWILVCRTEDNRLLGRKVEEGEETENGFVFHDGIWIKKEPVA